MADAFRMAVIAGRQAYESKLAKVSDKASNTSPLDALL
jgi:thiazole synthase ThiGH ThiG subunit